MKEKIENIQNKIDILSLKRLTVLSEKNDIIPFSSFWEKGQVIIIFIRHFGCPSCKAHVSDIWNQQSKLKNKRIIFIGNGQPSMIKGFKEEINSPSVEIYTDPSLETFEACGLKRGLRYLMNFKSIKSLLDLKRRGYDMSSWDDQLGDKTQMGGVIVLKKPGVLLYHFVSSYLGDFDSSKDWKTVDIS
ncbi:AhpC/TSA family protein [Halobacteriovorax sp.]|uniref:AhpC/TSA family protein n=1 Tax=Halobacteriovorax sp. TaxID=2020862 RepID=UPI003AF2EDFE